MLCSLCPCRSSQGTKAGKANTEVVVEELEGEEEEEEGGEGGEGGGDDDIMQPETVSMSGKPAAAVVKKGLVPRGAGRGRGGGKGKKAS